MTSAAPTSRHRLAEIGALLAEPARAGILLALIDGSARPAGRSAFPNAVGRSLALAITSPVGRIPGPSTGSVPGNLLNGNTASFTETYAGTTSSVSPTSASVSPSMTRAASDASGTPIALETNGMVRLPLRCGVTGRPEPLYTAAATGQ